MGGMMQDPLADEGSIRGGQLAADRGKDQRDTGHEYSGATTGADDSAAMNGAGVVGLAYLF